MDPFLSYTSRPITPEQTQGLRYGLVATGPSLSTSGYAASIEATQLVHQLLVSGSTIAAHILE